MWWISFKFWPSFYTFCFASRAKIFNECHHIFVRLIIKEHIFSRTKKEEWIKAKYVQKRFISKVASSPTSNSKLKRQNIVKRTAEGNVRRYSQEDRLVVTTEGEAKEDASREKRASVASYDSYHSEDEANSLHPNLVGCCCYCSFVVFVNLLSKNNTNLVPN